MNIANKASRKVHFLSNFHANWILLLRMAVPKSSKGSSPYSAAAKKKKKKKFSGAWHAVHAIAEME